MGEDINMWNNTKRTVIKQKIAEKPVDKVLERPPFRGADFILPGGVGGFLDDRPAISEITYYTVLRILSEAVGKLPIHVRNKDNEIVKNSTEKLLTVRPNNAMSPSQLFSYTEYCRNHYGNAYLYCDWSGASGKLQSITALDPRCVRIWVDDVSNDILQKYYYTYTTYAGNSYILASEDVVHLKAWHLDDQSRMIGIPVRDTLQQYMSAAQAGQATQANLYKSGMLIGGVLNYTADLSEEQKTELLDRVAKIGTKYKIVPLPQGWDLKPINLSLSDSQFLEGRKFTASQIAAAFGVNPTQLNDYSKGSYANSISQQLAFLTDTLMYISKIYEDELTYKLLSDKEISDGLHIDIDTEAVLQSTPDTLATILTKLVTGSVMTINEARQRENLPPIAGGDKLMAMPGATKLEEEKVVVE